MTYVKIEEVIDHLDSDMRRALRDAVLAATDAKEFNEHALFREFRRQVGRKCSTWVYVPDHYVRPQ